MAHVRKQTISFFLTTKCNLNCIYCYTHRNLAVKKEDQTLDFNFAKKGIDDFFRDYSSRSIRFYGAGESTLEFNLMKDITKYAESKTRDKVRVELQTNGIFSREIRDWVAKNVDILWISCDGPPQVQNAQRPTINGGESSSIVEEQIKFFVTQTKIQTGVRITLAASMMDKQIDIVEYFRKLGIKYINVHPACVSVEKDDKNIFQWDSVTFAKNFLKAHNEAKKQGVFYNTLYITNFDEKTRHACRSVIPYPHLTTDGYVSCCDFAQFGPEYSPGCLQQLIYGKYNAEEDLIVYDENKIHKIRSRCAENLQKGPCKGCNFVYHCAGGCLGQVVNETGDLMGIHCRNCEITKYLALRMQLNCGLYPVIHS